MMRALLLAALLATTALSVQAQSLVSPQADAVVNTNQGSVSSGFEYLFNGTTWDRARGGASTDSAAQIPNTGVPKAQMMLIGGSAGTLVPFGSVTNNGQSDANAIGAGVVSSSWIFNGTTWDRQRSIGGTANVGTGVPRVQVEEGYSSTLNVSAATNIKATAGRAFKVSVVTAGAVGQLCDTATACAAANVIMTVPAAVGVYDINWPFATGLRYEPGAAQVAAFTWQ